MIKARLDQIKSRMEAAAKRSGRQASDIGLVLVTKQVQVEDILEAYKLGIRDFGENRVQDWIEKKDRLPADIRWHLIGTLQTNKVKYILGNVHLIHSCDRLELASEIQKQAQKHGQNVDMLLQVNTSGETTKHGFEADQVSKAVDQIKSFDKIRLKGLMTIGPNTTNELEIRKSFATLRKLRDDLKKKYSDFNVLSMGMSSDFEYAIEEGADLVRIGSAVFGPRI